MKKAINAVLHTGDGNRAEQDTSSGKRKRGPCCLNHRSNKKRAREKVDKDDAGDNDAVDIEKEKIEEQRKEREREERQAASDAWVNEYLELTSRCPSMLLLDGLGRALSLSHVFSNAAKQYVSSVVTNVRYHLRSYVFSHYLILKNKVCPIYKVRSFEDRPRALREPVRRSWERLTRMFYNTAWQMDHSQQMMRLPSLRQSGTVPRVLPQCSVNINLFVVCECRIVHGAGGCLEHVR